jgi:hypothetical protein
LRQLCGCPDLLRENLLCSRHELLRGCPELLCEAGLRSLLRLRQAVVLRCCPELLRGSDLRLCRSELWLCEQLRLLELWLWLLLPPRRSVRRPVLRLRP